MLSKKTREHRVHIKCRRRWWDAGRVDRDRCKGRGSKESRKRVRASAEGRADGNLLMVKSFEEIRLIRSV
jgi:hypothetical protein